MALNDRQLRFAQIYAAIGNATQAAIKAGYSVRSAGSTGHDLLKHPEIKIMIQEIQQQTAERYQMTAENVIAEIANLAFSRFTDVAEVQGADPEVEGSENTIRFKNTADMEDRAIAAIKGAVSKVERRYSHDGELIETRHLKIEQHGKESMLKLAADISGATRDTGVDGGENYERLLKAIAGEYVEPIEDKFEEPEEAGTDDASDA